MDPLVALAAVAALVLVTAVLGGIAHKRGARVKRLEGAKSKSIDLDSLGVSSPDGSWSIVQFTTEWCAQCPGVARSIRHSLGDRGDTVFAEVDLTSRAELAAQHGILQTPTVFVVDPDGNLAARLSGPVKGSQVVAVIDSAVLT
ncbi:hypothetical protein GCM10010401_19220 [Rarobacter faecitabidus]|uniref:Thioredoxin n=1 Tax=Rarobacter faecitabidus TaxID=13243 RepID=A0A542ZV01_RARFA|nr:thioredoxin family protein [Rarobacter faecitabidus]TQL64129.1 thioredoxin [Rarobacter faecitabidus]